MAYGNNINPQNWGDTNQGNVGMPPSVFIPPEYTPPAPYVAPVYNEDKVTSLTQEAAAPAVRGLRSAMQTASSASYDNPNVKRMTLRDALAGYGQGLQSAVSGASTTARNQYNTEYGIAADTAKTNYQTSAQAAAMQYQGKLSAMELQYQTQWNAYLKEMEMGSRALGRAPSNSRGDYTSEDPERIVDTSGGSGGWGDVGGGE
jgi:hypothetical protein